MSAQKKQIRALFREVVFARDKHRCRTCPTSGPPLDAHHITDRTLMPGGGYVLENGITLCPTCHELAEVFHRTGAPAPGFAPEDLYRIVGSSEEKARKASLRLA